MTTPMKGKYEVWAWRSAWIPYIIAAVFGAIYIIFAATGALVPWHESFLGIPASTIIAFNANLMVLYSWLLWVMGFLFLTVFFLGFVVVFIYHEKISFGLVFGSCFLLLVPCLLETWALGAIIPLIAVIVSMGFWLAAVGLFLLSSGHQ